MNQTRRIVCDLGGNLKAPPTTVLLLPAGFVQGANGDFIVDDESARSIIAAHRQRGVDFVIDYEHQSLGGAYAPPSGIAPAAAWIKSFSWRPGVGLFASVDWTRPGAERVSCREYRYLSPVVHVDSNLRVVALDSVGLTNRPAIAGMVPIVNSRMHVSEKTDRVNESGDTPPPGMTAARFKAIKAAIAEWNSQPALMTQYGVDLISWVDDTLLRDGQPHVNHDEWRMINGEAPAGMTGIDAVRYQMEHGSALGANRCGARNHVASMTLIAARRAFVMVRASIAYDMERAAKHVTCSRAKWVNNALREENLRLLTDQEQSDTDAGEPISVVAARTNSAAQIPDSRRSAVVNMALREYRSNDSIRRACSCVPWVNQALRDAGLPVLNADEARLID